MGDCSFRDNGTNDPVVAEFADELCWIDMKEAPTLSSPRSVTKDLGRYTMSYTMGVTVRDRDGNVTTTSTQGGIPNWSRVAVGMNSLDAMDPRLYNKYQAVDAASVFGNTVAGVNYFVPEAGDSNRPVVETDQHYTSRGVFEFTFTDIKVVDKVTGKAVAKPRLVVADAQMTAQGAGSEVFTVDSTTPGVTSPLQRRITPDVNGYRDACYPDPGSSARSKNIFGPTNDKGLWGPNHNTGPADFMCYEYSGAIVGGTYSGSFVTALDGAKDLKISLASWSSQAFALAIDMGRMRGTVTADTSLERLATGQETDFDFRMGLSDGTSVPWQGSSTYTQVLRPGSDYAHGYTSGGQQVFSSRATGSQADAALRRYDPVWTCTTPAQEPTTIRADSVPSGYQLTNDGTTSRLGVDNAQNEALTCNVHWTPKYVPASLDLGKAVAGTAALYAEIADRSFDLSYSCVPAHGASGTDQQAIDEFVRAYPDQALSGTTTLDSGGRALVTGLPAGATCTVREAESAVPSTTSGVDHTLSWSGATAGKPPAPGALAPATVVLQPDDMGDAANAVRATNTYTAHTGTLVLGKTVSGDPVGQTFGASKTYRFDVACRDAGFRETLALTLSAAGTNQLTGSGTLRGVPTGRACTITPLTGLDSEQQHRVRFDGRTLTIDGTQVEANPRGAYPFTIPDHVVGATPTTSRIVIDARYSWKTAPVKVFKELQGPGATVAAQAYTTFPARYDCQVPGDAASRRTGDLELTTDRANPATITGIRVDAQCRVWERAVPEDGKVILDRTTVTGSDPDDHPLTLTNDEARSTPVLTVHDTVDSNQNTVTFTNRFANRLGTVTLTKRVDDGGLSAALPHDYAIRFTCGERGVEGADGLTTVALTGTATLGRDDTVALVADDATVNDGPDGTMRVPYGNTCTFSEEQPVLAASGVLWAAEFPTVTVDEASETATITNRFRAAGDGLTVTRHPASNPHMAGPLAYTLTCTNAGSPLPLPGGGRFTLEGTDSVTFSPAQVPTGSRCRLTADPVGDSDRQRTVDDVTFPVRWDEEATYPKDAAGSRATASGGSDGDPLAIDGIVIGDRAVVTLTDDYSYVRTSLEATKSVEFPESPSYISDERQAVKKDRPFTVVVECTAPYGERSTLSGVIVHGTTRPKTAVLRSNSVPVGARCVATEAASSTANGIDLTQHVSVNGGEREANGASVQVSGPTTVEFINAYRRRLASVELDKIANTPFDLTDHVGQFHHHTFTMRCVDPLSADQTELATFTGSIDGPGQHTFEGVPVGAECSITGDAFGRLDLATTDDDGTPLELHLRSASVDWQLVRNDGATERDTALADGVTTSPSFVVEDDAPTGAGNRVNLTNNYEVVPAPITFTQTITAPPDVFAELDAADPTLSVALTQQCKGVGYANGSISTTVDGQQGRRLPDEVTLAMVGDEVRNPDGTVTRTYRGPEGLVAPSGAWCTLVTAVRGVPDGVQASTRINGEERTTFSQRIAEGSDPGAQFRVETRLARTLVPVRIAALKDGHLTNVRGEYVLTVTCDDHATTTRRVVHTVDEIAADDTVADPLPTTGGTVVELPAGARCTLDADAQGAHSSALDALPSLAMTAGDRRPFIVFGRWDGTQASQDNPTTRPSMLTAADVTPAMKRYQHTFTVPTDAAVTATGEAITIAAEAVYLQDRVPLTITKRTEGSKAAPAAHHRFVAACSSGSAAVAKTVEVVAGQSVTIDDVPVDGTCSLSEESGPDADGGQPLLSVGEVGDRLADVVATNVPATDAQPWSRTITATVQPVADASATGDPAWWSLTAVNRYPALEVTKSIVGGALDDPADTALLDPAAAWMTVNYEVTNQGALDVADLRIAEPGLAGRTVRTDAGAEVTIGADGAVPASVCPAVGTRLAQAGRVTCTFDVRLTDPTSRSFTYDAATAGVVTVSGSYGDGAVRLAATDRYGAFRPAESETWRLPRTGSRSLLLVLLLGVAGVCVGLARRRRAEGS